MSTPRAPADPRERGGARRTSAGDGRTRSGGSGYRGLGACAKLSVYLCRAFTPLFDKVAIHIPPNEPPVPKKEFCTSKVLVRTEPFRGRDGYLGGPPPYAGDSTRAGRRERHSTTTPLAVAGPGRRFPLKGARPSLGPRSPGCRWTGPETGVWKAAPTHTHRFGFVGRLLPSLRERGRKSPAAAGPNEGWPSLRPPILPEGEGRGWGEASRGGRGRGGEGRGDRRL